MPPEPGPVEPINQHHIYFREGTAVLPVWATSMPNYSSVHIAGDSRHGLLAGDYLLADRV